MFREGQQIGAYTLIGKLGKGGFGEVWLAEKRSQFIVKRVAVKLPLEEQVNFEAIRQEATLWEAASGHPNVYDGQVVIVSEYAEGGSLYDRLKQETKLPLKEAVEMAIGILNGLEFLHSRKIIHRDIKPQNILLQGNTPRLADFGISRAMNTTLVSSAIIGTDAYMSPESLDGKRSIQTDIWSVGVVLYQMLKGSLPFPQEHPTERMFAVLTKDFEPLSDEIPADLRRIVGKALQKLPENRFQTTSEMRDELLKAHVPLAHPTLAKTEVLRFPAEPKTIDETVSIDEKKEIAVNEPPNFVNHPPVFAPAPTQPAMPQESVVTNLKQTPFVKETPQFVQSAASQKMRRKFLKIGIIVVGLILFVMAAGIFLALETNYISFKDASGKYGFRNEFKRVVIEPKYEDAQLSFLNNKLAAVKLNGKWGYIDRSGKEVIPFKFDEAWFFSQGLAAVKSNDKWGFIDENGVLVIPYKYSMGAFFESDGYAKVYFNNKRLRIDKNGNETDLGAVDHSNTNPNISTYNTPASNSSSAH
jgi:serine/threonine protein kinase